MLYYNKITQVCSKTRLEAQWKFSAAHWLRNTGVEQGFSTDVKQIISPYNRYGVWCSEVVLNKGSTLQVLA